MGHFPLKADRETRWLSRRRMASFILAGVLMLVAPHGAHSQTEAVSPYLSVARAAIEAAKIFGPKAPSVQELIDLQTGLIEKIIRQIEIVNRKIDIIINELERINRSIEEVPERTAFVFYRDELRGIAIRYRAIMETYSNYKKNHKLSENQEMIGLKIENEILSPLRDLRSRLLSYNEDGIVSMLTTSARIETHAMILAKYDRQQMIPQVNSYIYWLERRKNAKDSLERRLEDNRASRIRIVEEHRKWYHTGPHPHWKVVTEGCINWHCFCTNSIIQNLSGTGEPRVEYVMFAAREKWEPQTGEIASAYHELVNQSPTGLKNILYSDGGSANSIDKTDVPYTVTLSFDPNPRLSFIFPYRDTNLTDMNNKYGLNWQVPPSEQYKRLRWLCEDIRAHLPRSYDPAPPPGGYKLGKEPWRCVNNYPATQGFLDLVQNDMQKQLNVNYAERIFLISTKLVRDRLEESLKRHL